MEWESSNESNQSVPFWDAAKVLNKAIHIAQIKAPNKLTFVRMNRLMFEASEQMTDAVLYAKVSRTHYGAYLQKYPEGTPKDYLERYGCFHLATQPALSRQEEITVMHIRVEFGWRIVWRSPQELFEDQREFLEVDDEALASMSGLKKFGIGY